MNKEVIKAMNRKENRIDKIRHWWDNNNYKILRVIFFPIVLFICLKEKYIEWCNSRISWDIARAKEIFDYYIPRKSKWNSKNKCFYFFNNGYGWTDEYSKRYIKLKDRYFWHKFTSGWCGGDMRDYLIREYELEGFEKEIESTYDGNTEINFYLKET